MTESIKTATEMFGSGFNCAQSVLGAFCQKYGMELTVAQRIACPLGSGVRSAEICGAVSGAALVIGLKYGDSKEICDAKTEEFVHSFKRANGHLVCREILKCDITTPGGKEEALGKNLFSTVCMDMVVSAAGILEELGY